MCIRDRPIPPINNTHGLTAALAPVSYTHLRAHETSLHLVCRLLLEKKIKEYLLEETPNISINAEESGKLNKSSDLTWCIDPLDGTTNYSHGYPFFGTSIGLVFKNKPIIGAISVPYLNELYSACIGLSLIHI